jgi:hypothetical protein
VAAVETAAVEVWLAWVAQVEALLQGKVLLRLVVMVSRLQLLAAPGFWRVVAIAMLQAAMGL